jgi:Flp pilus assembly protein CpaB
MADYRAASAQARRLLARYRRVLGAVLVSIAVLATIESLAPAPSPSRPVVVAARELDPGATLSAADLRVVRMPPALVPAGASSSVSRMLGAVLTGAMHAGEVVTDLRLLGRSLLARYPPGLVAASVRIGDPAVVELLHVGDRIDVFAADSDRAPADLVVRGVTVVALPQDGDTSREGALVVLALTVTQAARLARAAAAAPLSIALLR